MAVPLRSKISLLPVLVFLFVVSYGILTLLVVEQGKTIDSQRYLIQELFQDSAQLTDLKSKALEKEHAAANGRKRQIPQTQAPKSQVTPPPNGPSKETTKENSKAGKLQKSAPLKPPKDMSDSMDERRSRYRI